MVQQVPRVVRECLKRDDMKLHDYSSTGPERSYCAEVSRCHVRRADDAQKLICSICACTKAKHADRTFRLQAFRNIELVTSCWDPESYQALFVSLAALSFWLCCRSNTGPCMRRCSGAHHAYAGQRSSMCHRLRRRWMIESH